MRKRKKKHLSLSIKQKVENLQKPDCVVPVRPLPGEYGVGTTTVYDLKKQKDKLLKFYCDSDDKKQTKRRKHCIRQIMKSLIESFYSGYGNREVNAYL